MSQPVAISIGNFDGVHAGHRALIKRAREAVSRRGSTGHVVVLAFDPHPASVLRPGQQPDLLTTFSQRTQLLTDAGVDQVQRLEPSERLLGMTPQAFIESVVAEHRPSFIVEGPDFRFGRGRAGSIQTLESLGTKHGFEVDVVQTAEVVLSDHALVPARSSMVRWLLDHGRVADATRMLERSYQVSAVVECGAKQGRELGFPTANCGQVSVMLPADGVYAGFANDPAGQMWPAAISIGSKPTFGGQDRVCEVHLIGYEGSVDEYDWLIEVDFHCWIREQLAFGSAVDLIEQMKRDVAHAASILEVNV